MDAVALAAAIGGAVVGVAGVASGIFIAKIQRRQAVELAAGQHVHERELARGDRLYERRAPVYESMMGIVVTVMEHVAARYIAAGRPPANLPAEPTVDDQRAVLVRLRTHGTPEVSDAYRDWLYKVEQFRWLAITPNGDEQMEDARKEAVAAAEALGRLVTDELAAL